MKPPTSPVFSSVLLAFLIGIPVVAASFLGVQRWMRHSAAPGRTTVERNQLFVREIEELRTSIEVPAPEIAEVEQLKKQLEKLETETLRLEAETSDLAELSGKADGITANQSADNPQKEMAAILEELRTGGKKSKSDLDRIQGRLRKLESTLIEAGFEKDRAFAPIFQSLKDLQKQAE